MTKGYSPSSLAKPRAAALITLAVLLFTFCLKTFGVIAPFRRKTLDLLFRHLPFAKASPEVVVVAVDQPDLDFCKRRRWSGPEMEYLHKINVFPEVW